MLPLYHNAKVKKMFSPTRTKGELRMITTVSRTLAQQIVSTVHDICGHDINFINKKGIIFASTDESRIGTFHEIGKEAADTQTTIEVTENDNYKGTYCGVNIPVSHNGFLIAVIGISGNPEEVRSFARLAERITRLLIREQELGGTAHTFSEKKRFLLNSLISETLDAPEFVLLSLKDFHVNEDTPKRILILRLIAPYSSTAFLSAENKITGLFDRLGITLFCDYYPDKFIALADEQLISENIAALKSFSSENKDLLQIGIGCASGLYQLNASYRTANTALANASMDRAPFSLFDDLTLEIILSSIPENNRNEYLTKVLSGLSDKDILLLRTYYEESQSLSRTCEKLFLHKNTLQYKLNRIHHICGLNPRDFKDAVILYLAVKIQEHGCFPYM